MHFKKLCLTKMCSFTKWYVECILTYFYCDSLLCMLLPLPTMSLHVRSHTQAKNIFLWTKESNLNLSLSFWPLKICRYCNYYHYLVVVVIIIIVVLGIGSVWPDCVIYCTLGNFSKHVATINLPKLPSLLSNFCKGIKIFHFSSEISFGQLL